MATDDTRHRLAAIMFTDIVGYSRLMGDDEERTISLVEDYRAILAPIIGAHDGTVLEYIGDGVFARFESGLAAVRAGIQIQQALARFNEGRADDEAMRSRIGIHLGDVVFKADEIYGDDVNIGARLEPLAEPGGICISQAVYEQVRRVRDIRTVSLGPKQLKNIREPVNVYQVVVGDLSRPRRMRYRLSYLGNLLRVRPWISAAGGAALVAALAVTVGPYWFSDARAHYVAVSTFRNLSNDPGKDYFSEGVTEAIQGRLMKVPNLYLVKWENDIGAPLILEGSVQNVAQHVRIVYRVRRRDGRIVGGGQEDGEAKEIFSLQDRVTSSIYKLVAREFGLHGEAPRGQLATTSITAYDYYLQARDYLRRPKTSATLSTAIGLFETALKHDAKFAKAEAGLCEALWWKYDHLRNASLIEAAEKNCERALELDSSLAEVHIALGTIYSGTGRWQKAVTAFNRAIALDPKREEAFIGLGGVFEGRNEIAKAEQTYRRAIQLQPGYWNSYYQLGNFFLEQGKIEQAINAYAHVIELTPDNGPVYSNLGGAYFFSGEFDKAAEAFRESLRLTPESAAAFSNTGTMYYYAGEYAQAEKMFEKTTVLAPGDYRGWLNLGDARRQISTGLPAAGAYRRAIALGEQRLRVNPNDAQAYQYLAMARFHLGEREAAQRGMDRALTLAPKNAEILYWDALIRSQRGNAQGALAALEKALDAGISIKLVEADPDLTALHRTEHYRTLVLRYSNKRRTQKQLRR